MSTSTSSQNNTAIFDIVVQPKSSQSRIRISDNVIKVYLHSPPVDGKANEECITLISKTLKIAKSNIEIARGDHGKKKSILVRGMSVKEVIDIFNRIK